MSAAYFVKAPGDGAPRAGTVAATLLAAGLTADTPVAFIEWAAVMRACRVRATLGTLDEQAAAQDGTQPALVLVGEIPEVVATPGPAEDRVDEENGEDAFLVYGRSWFCG